MPGAGFKSKARKWRKLSQAMINVPYNMVKEKFVSRLSILTCDSAALIEPPIRKLVVRCLVSSQPAWSKTLLVSLLEKDYF